MKADLHIHSTVSDGSDTIGEIIRIAEQSGLDAIAVTDHDTCSHLEQISLSEQSCKQGLQDAPGIKIIGGVELSAVHRPTNTRAHILGYHIQKPEVIKTLTAPLLKARNENSEKQAEILIRYGLQIDMDKLSRADGKYLYKQHIMDWLVRTGQVSEMFGDFYYHMFKNGGICEMDIEYLDMREAVRAIKEAGGLAVLAHPGQQQNFWLIPELLKEGLDGLELNHHSHTDRNLYTIRSYAAENDLFMTGGSDYHGRFEPQIFGIGDFLSDESGVNAIC